MRSGSDRRRSDGSMPRCPCDRSPRSSSCPFSRTERQRGGRSEYGAGKNSNAIHTSGSRDVTGQFEQLMRSSKHCCPFSPEQASKRLLDQLQSRKDTVIGGSRSDVNCTRDPRSPLPHPLESCRLFAQKQTSKSKRGKKNMHSRRKSAGKTRQ